MIINVGGRTDIVNYYTPWLLRRLDEGSVLVRNPFSREHVTRYRLDPRVVDCIVFCSKNYEPILPHMADIAARFNVLCHYTITAYGPDVEPSVPSVERSIETLRRLSAIVGPERVVWRYDPILLTGRYTVGLHLDTFGRMAAQLMPYVGRCVFSFVTMYRRLEANMPEIIPLTAADRDTIASGIGCTARRLGLRLQTCGDSDSYARYGIEASGCITSATLGEALGCRFVRVPHKGSRPGCHCMPMHDIGAYDTCPNGCRYCYANRDPQTARRNILRHNPDSPMLLGSLLPGDRVTDAVQRSFITTEPELF